MKEMKVCSKCAEEKPIDEFGFRKETGKYRNACKACIKQQGELRQEKALKEGLPEGRVCSKCGEYKTKEHFSLHKGKLRSNCSKCEYVYYYANDLENNRAKKREYGRLNSEKKKAWYERYYAENKEFIAARARESYAQNIEERRAKSVDYYNRNVERYKAYRVKARLLGGEAYRIKTNEAARLFRTKYPEACAVATQNHRAFKLDLPGKLSVKQIRSLKAAQNNECHYCGCSIENYFEIEHAQPLSRGGTNYIYNIRLSCQFCNQSKGAKTEEEFFEYMRLKDVIRQNLKQAA